MESGASRGSGDGTRRRREQSGRLTRRDAHRVHPARTLGDRIFVATLGALEGANKLTGDEDGLWDHQQPAWSPDGNELCYSGQRDLWIVPAAGGAAHRLTDDDEVDEECVWSPGGRYVYFSSNREGSQALWRVPSGGGTAERVTLGGGPEVHPSLSRRWPPTGVLDIRRKPGHRAAGVRDARRTAHRRASR